MFQMRQTPLCERVRLKTWCRGWCKNRRMCPSFQADGILIVEFDETYNLSHPEENDAQMLLFWSSRDLMEFSVVYLGINLVKRRKRKKWTEPHEMCGGVKWMFCECKIIRMWVKLMRNVWVHIKMFCLLCQTGTALKDRTAEGLAAAAALPAPLESKASNGQQALLQHLLLKEQRQQRMMSPGEKLLRPERDQTFYTLLKDYMWQ